MPRKAKAIAGIPNRTNTFLSAFLPTRETLYRLLKKCTTPVKAIARSTGKNTIKIGVSNVPSPKPEKNVKIAAKNATKQMRKKSTKQRYKFPSFVKYPIPSKEIPLPSQIQSLSFRAFPSGSRYPLYLFLEFDS